MFYDKVIVIKTVHPWLQRYGNTAYNQVRVMVNPQFSWKKCF